MGTADELRNIITEAERTFALMVYRRVDSAEADGRYVIGGRAKLPGLPAMLATAIVDVNERAFMGQLALRGHETIGSAVEDRIATLRIGYAA